MKEVNSQDKIVQIYDTTLRDGTQQRGISLSVDDKLRCTEVLAAFGLDYIEGGWPGSNPKDEAYFAEVGKLPLGGSKVTAFGATRRKDTPVEEDAQVAKLLESGAGVITLVGKASAFQVQELLKTSLEENCSMIADTVAYCKAAGREVVFDAEHFFDGYFADAEYALRCLDAAQGAGADVLVLCDTNGGTLPGSLAEVVRTVVSHCSCRIGIHTHNDAEVGVANALLAVEAGARHVQGTINGYGERCGNANLISIIPALLAKMGYETEQELDLTKLTSVSRQIAELVNENHQASQPYVGRSAFAHKGGLHAAAVERFPASYEHLPPETLGNEREIVVSELSGRGSVRMIARDSGLSLGDTEAEVLELIKQREHQGYAYESAEGSAELLMRRASPEYRAAFTLIDSSVVSRSTNAMEPGSVQAAVKVCIGEQEMHTVADGFGPVHALDLALRKALVPVYPDLSEVRLTNYKVRILNPRTATEAKTRVMIEASDAHQSWVTVGCSENIIQASIEALLDSYELYLLRHEDLKELRYENS